MSVNENLDLDLHFRVAKLGTQFEILKILANVGPGQGSVVQLKMLTRKDYSIFQIEFSKPINSFLYNTPK